jgi:hypothetical protein
MQEEPLRCKTCRTEVHRVDNMLVPVVPVRNIYVIPFLQDKYEVMDCKTCGQKVCVLKVKTHG